MSTASATTHAELKRIAEVIFVRSASIYDFAKNGIRSDGELRALAIYAFKAAAAFVGELPE